MSESTGEIQDEGKLLWDCMRQILLNQTFLLSIVLHKEARDTMQDESNELIKRIEAKTLTRPQETEG